MDCIRTLVELGAELESKNSVRSGTRRAAWRRVRRLTLTARVAWQLGRAPLAIAAYNGHMDCMRAMMELGAELEAKDNVRAAKRRVAQRRSGG